jgi:ankyrin repeat protein
LRRSQDREEGRIEGGDVSTIEAAERQGGNKTGTPQDIQAAIDEGADVNGRSSNGLTPFIISTTLLNGGADLKARDLYDVGATALGWAAWNNSNPGVIAALLKAGGDVNSRDTEDERTPAASKGFTVDKKLDVPDPS